MCNWEEGNDVIFHYVSVCSQLSSRVESNDLKVLGGVSEAGKQRGGRLVAGSP